MEALVCLGILFVAGIAWAMRIASRPDLGSAMHSACDQARMERYRMEECAQVVRFFANHLGYVARQYVSREQISAWIDSGISADELADRIWSALGDAKGVILGHYPLGSGRIPVLLPEGLRSRHMYVVGKSGSGKTTLLQNLILQDLEAGRGLAVLAPEAEMLRDELLPFVPEHRWQDIIFVNPADTERPVPLNPLHLEVGEDIDLKVDETVTIFQRVFAEDGATAPRMEAILRQALYLLMRIPGATLLDMERLLDRHDPSFRNWATSQDQEPEVVRFWQQTYPAYPKDAHLPLLNRLGRFLQPRVVRNLVCAQGCLNLRAAMDEGKVVLFNLSDGLLGTANAELLGQLVVAKLQLAAMSRADLPKEERRPFTVYLDEFQAFCGVASTSYERILSRARKYGLGLVLAHQQTGQIPEHLMREILGNVSTTVCFNVGASDARRLGREMIGEIDGQTLPLDRKELLALRVGEAWCRIDRNVFFLRSAPPVTGGNVRTREEVVCLSRERYGARPGKVDLLPDAHETITLEHDAKAAQVEPASPLSQPEECRRPTRTAKSAVPRRALPSMPVVGVPTGGRGSAQHKYLQELLKRWAEARDWRVMIEEQVLGGLGHIDVALRKGDLSVACEISVTTTSDHEVENIQKCLAAGFDHVLLVSARKSVLNTVRQHVAVTLSEAECGRVSFGTPDEAFEILERFEATGSETIGTVRGYAVRVKYRRGVQSEVATKRQAVSAVVARALKRLKV